MFTTRSGLKKALIFTLTLITLLSLSTTAWAAPPSSGLEPAVLDAEPDNAPISPDGVINNDYWGIVGYDPYKAAENTQAFNAALAWASDNGVTDIKLQTGRYYVDGQHTRIYSVSDKSIDIPSNIAFDLGGSKLIQIPNNKDGYAIFTIIGSDNVSIFNGSLIGDADMHIYSEDPGRSHEYGLGIDIRGGTNVTIEGLDIYNMTGDSILVGGKDTYLSEGGSISEDVTITGCYLHNNRRQGISVIGARDVLITECAIFGIGQTNGTDPSCGIDLENELDWPIENVRITKNMIFDNKKAGVLVHRGSVDTLIEENKISGYIVLVYGDNTMIENNQVVNGGIYSVDTFEPTHTSVINNQLYNANIEVFKNTGTIVGDNVINEGVIKMNYATGAIYNNTISNEAVTGSAIQVYSDKQAKGNKFEVYLYGNEVGGSVAGGLAVSNNETLRISYDRAEVQQYIASFRGDAVLLEPEPLDNEPVPLDNEPVPLYNIEQDYTIWIVAAAGAVLIIAAALWLILRKMRQAS